MKKFVIKEGRHYCEWFWTKVFHPHYDHQHWDGIFRLDRSCWWHPARDGNDYDINKIIGVSFGLWHHHNSWRLGFVPIFEELNKFKLYGYFYDTEKNIHEYEYIGIIDADVNYYYNVKSVDNRYFIKVDGVGYCDHDNVIKDDKLQFMLCPYIGGNNSAIRDMIMHVKLNFK